MALLTAKRVAECLYSSWCDNQSSTELIAGKTDLDKFITHIPDPLDFAGKILTANLAKIAITWTHTYAHTSCNGKLNFVVALNGWHIGQVSVGYACDIMLMSSNFKGNKHTDSLMYSICIEVAETILHNPDLAKFVEKEPAQPAGNPYITNDGDLLKLVNEGYSDSYEKYKNSFDAYYNKIEAELKEQYIQATKEKFEAIYNQPYKKPTFTLEPPTKKWSGQTVEKRTTDLFPGLKTMVKCPVCGADWILYKLIQHLNDSSHLWARTANEAKPGEPNIADWLDEWSATTGVSLEMRDDNVSEGR